MDRGKVDDVEPHRVDVVEAPLGVSEGSGSLRFGPLGTDEQLVPRAQARAFAVRIHDPLGLGMRLVGPRRQPRHQRSRLSGRRHRDEPRGIVGGRAQAIE
jgi:hypothetical protein